MSLTKNSDTLQVSARRWSLEFVIPNNLEQWMNRLTRSVCVWAFLAVWLTAAAAHAQTSTVTGTVTDPLGGRLPGATVTLAGERQPAGETTASRDGAFTFTNVAP